MRYPYSYICPFYNPDVVEPYIMYTPLYRHISWRENDMKIVTNEIEYENEYIKVHLKYPELQGLDNKKVQDFINTSIKNDVMEFKNQMENAAKEAAKEAEMHGEEFQPFIISCKFDVNCRKYNIISISITYYEYINRKHSYIKVSYNFNLANGEPLSLKDLFKEGVNYQKILDKEIRKELLLNKEKYLPNAAENFKGIKKYHPFYLENGNIVVYFGFHEISPVESEIPIIKIPISSLRNYIKPEFLN